MHWRTKDGRLISITDMTDPHLDNAIAMLKRNFGLAVFTNLHYQALVKERRKREYCGHEECRTSNQHKLACIAYRRALRDPKLYAIWLECNKEIP